MRYAIPFTEKNLTLLTQPVDIPDPLPGWASDVLAFLTKMFPDFSGWIRVADDNVSGAVLQEDGSYKNPSEPTPG